MDYSTYLADAGMKKGKLSAYKSHIVGNIEKIGQKKLVIIGGGEDYGVLLQALDQLRKKDVKGSGYRVPGDDFRKRDLGGERYPVHKRA